MTLINPTTTYFISVALVSIDWDVVDLVESTPEFKVFGFFDPSTEYTKEDIPYLGNDDSWARVKNKYPFLKIILAIDAPALKARLFNHYEESLITIVSPHAYVSKRASLNIGSIIQRGVTIMPNTCIGKACKLNVHATVHHDVKIGDFCTIAPGALVLGRVLIEEEVYVGAGAIIRQRCKIGKGAVIGAGAVVVNDVPAGITVVGIPAKPLIKFSKLKQI